MLAALLTFGDHSEEVHNGNNSSGTPPTTRTPSGEPVSGPRPETVEQIQVKAGVCDILRF